MHISPSRHLLRDKRKKALFQLTGDEVLNYFGLLTNQPIQEVESCKIIMNLGEYPGP